MIKICKLFDYTKQGFYKHRKYFENYQRLVDKVISEVKLKRADQHHIGVRKLQYMLGENGINIGRDKLFDILRDHNMLSTVYRRKYITSTGRRSKYPNLVKSHNPVQEVGEIIASDITYLHTKKRPVYLSLTSDHFSGSILGYSLQQDLSTKGPLQALYQAKKVLCNKRYVIHHSDHGVQYTSNQFQQTLRQYNYRTSMTGIGKCYDNAKAERINGILKHELGLNRVFRDFDEALVYVKDAIKIYNDKRIIITKGYKTPFEILNVA